MDTYQQNAKLQGVGSYLGAIAKSTAPNRTFDAIAVAVGELRDLNARLDSALGRLGQERCEKDCADPAALQVVGPDYSRSLRHLDAQISELRSNISALESHI
jgi:hypothetical protein